MSDPEASRKLSIEKSAEGHKLLKAKCYEDAASLFSEALELMIQACNNDEMHIDCGTFHYDYADALVRAIESRADVFGDALTKTEEASEKDNHHTEENTEETGNGTEETVSDDLCLAWELLETARIIFERHPSSSNTIKLGDVFCRLGDIEMESDNLEGAKNDYLQCLEIRRTLLKSDDRQLSSIHYTIGVNFIFSNDVVTGITHFIEAANILKCRVMNLLQEANNHQESIEPFSVSIATAKLNNITKNETNQVFLEEIQDLLGIIKDLDERIEDYQEQIRMESNTAPQVAVTTQPAVTSHIGFPDAPVTGPVQMLTVKRKTPSSNMTVASSSSSSSSLSALDNEQQGPHKKVKA